MEQASPAKILLAKSKKNKKKKGKGKKKTTNIGAFQEFK